MHWPGHLAKCANPHEVSVLHPRDEDAHEADESELHEGEEDHHETDDHEDVQCWINCMPKDLYGSGRTSSFEFLTTFSKQVIIFAYVSNCTELWTYTIE